MVFGESDPAANEYGPNPKGIDYHDDWDPFANEEREQMKSERRNHF